MYTIFEKTDKREFHAGKFEEHSSSLHCGRMFRFLQCLAMKKDNSKDQNFLLKNDFKIQRGSANIEVFS